MKVSEPGMSWSLICGNRSGVINMQLGENPEKGGKGGGGWMNTSRLNMKLQIY